MHAVVDKVKTTNWMKKACEQWHAPFKIEIANPQLVLVLFGCWLARAFFSRFCFLNVVGNGIEMYTHSTAEQWKIWFNLQLIYDIYNYRFCLSIIPIENYILPLMPIGSLWMLWFCSISCLFFFALPCFMRIPYLKYISYWNMERHVFIRLHDFILLMCIDFKFIWTWLISADLLEIRRKKTIVECRATFISSKYEIEWMTDIL